MIRNLHHNDAGAVLEIYRQGLDTGEASFETEPPNWPTWDSKYHEFCRLVWEQDGEVTGWAALAPVSARDCYRGVAEISIYIATRCLGRGIGSELMAAIVAESENQGIWSLYSSIFPENQATRRLHLKHGFREVGIRERIAQRDGRWRDTLILERRSRKVGCDTSPDHPRPGK
jgi:phosphinothricin acetyltransferase